MTRFRPACWLLLLLLPMGCAQLPSHAGRDQVAGHLGLPESVLADPGERQLDAVRPLLLQPLSPERAVQVAWRNSPRVRQALAHLGLAAADWFEARRPGNPTLGYGRLGNGDAREITVGLHWAISDLLLLPARRDIGEQEWQAAIANVAGLLQAEAAAVRRDYYRYQAAMQVAALREAEAEAASLAAELAQRYHQAGNLEPLKLAREQAHASEAAHLAAQARAERLMARLKLAERLGLAGLSNAWSLPERLPLPSGSLPPVDALLQQAREQRADLAAARLKLAAADGRRRLTAKTRWFGELELELEREREGGEHRDGIGLGLSLPLFHQGQAALARGDARREMALQTVIGIEQSLEREVRTGSAQLQTLAQIIADYQRTLLPARRVVVEREMERYNYMLIGAFELLDARKAELNSWTDYYRTIADYWSTHAELGVALGRPLPDPDGSALAPAAEEIIAPAAGDAQQHHHGSQAGPGWPVPTRKDRP